MTNLTGISCTRLLLAVGLATSALIAPTAAWADATPECNTGTGVGSTECGVDSAATADLATAAGATTTASMPGSSAFGAQAVASGTAATALGHNSDATALAATAVGVSAQATATAATAIGRIANASGISSTAIGAVSQATADSSVALGAGSIANQVNTVSVGAVGAERRIVNVAAGTAATDAVNFGQLSAVNTTLASGISALQSDTDLLFDLTDRLRDDIRDANEGVAMALAMDSPNIPAGAKFAVSGGIGHFKGRTAFAAAVSAAVGQMSSVSAGIGYGINSKDIGARAGFQVAW